MIINAPISSLPRFEAERVEKPNHQTKPGKADAVAESPNPTTRTRHSKQQCVRRTYSQDRRLRSTPNRLGVHHVVATIEPRDCRKPDIVVSIQAATN
jgi:hypothetical protein